MSLTNNQEEVLQDLREDFDFFLKQEKWSDCAAIIQSVGDMGQENEVISLHHRLNQAKKDAMISRVHNNFIDGLEEESEDPRDYNDRTGMYE